MELFQAKHELWLQLLFASFATPDNTLKERLYEYSQITFRHLKWIAKAYRAQNRHIHFRRSSMTIAHPDMRSMLAYLEEALAAIQPFYTNDPLASRIETDDAYFAAQLQAWQNDTESHLPLQAFDRHLTYGRKQLTQIQRDALIRFLFEESYKEYELILVYFYMQTYTDSRTQFDIYDDLINESHFHLKSFGNMMALMGILSLPREVHEMSYKITDLHAFVLNGIDEELAAKEECRRLAEAVEDEELTRFFNFINYQENYHIELMKSLL